jgi:hypothetical protein
MPPTIGATGAIRAACCDPLLDARLAAASQTDRPLGRHFNQAEEFFVRLEARYAVPPLPIHHDVQRARPDPGYSSRLRELADRLLELAPQLLRGLAYLFDPAEILRPCFYRLHRLEERQYLYLLRLDLSYRPRTHRVLEAGTNDLAPAFLTRDLYLESLLLPLERVEASAGRVESFTVEQAIADTWVGETGRGYFAQGLWMDNDLTRFFSRLFLPEGKRTYPFYPYLCRFKTFCQQAIRFAGAQQAAALPEMHRAYGYLRPLLGRVQAALKGAEFSESDPLFRELKSAVPETWCRTWQGLQVKAYLDEEGMKEYRIEDPNG